MFVCCVCKCVYSSGCIYVMYVHMEGSGCLCVVYVHMYTVDVYICYVCTYVHILYEYIFYSI